MKNLNPNAESCASQKALILAHLQTGATLTSLEALERYGCFRLSGRILDLKEEGHTINSQLVKINGKYVSEYTLIQKVAQ